MRFLLVTDTHHQDLETELLQRKFWQMVNKTERFDAIIHTGDWGTISLQSVKEAFEIIRSENGETPIYSVLGNHDLWDSDKSIHIESRLKMVSQFAQNNSIDLIEENPYELENFWIVGLMGWYKSLTPPTNDLKYLPLTSAGSAHLWLNRRASKNFNDLTNIDFKGKKVIFLSHFSMVREIFDREDLSGDPFMGEEILKIADIYCHGHSHFRIDKTVGKTRILNAGAAYLEMPKYLIFEI